MGVLAPPYVKLSWTASSLTTNFGSYRIYRRPSRTPYVAWSLIGELSVPTGYTAATVEAQHTTFRDYDMGWYTADQQWASGWEYAVSTVNATTGVESTKATLTSAVQPTADTTPWITSNAAPWLNLPVAMHQLSTDDSDSTIYTAQPAARDAALTRNRFELPYRTARLAFYELSRRGQDTLRTWRAAHALGQAMALHIQGDRMIGVLRPLTGVDRSIVGDYVPTAGMIETVREATGYVVADFNSPAGVVFDGSADYITTADNALLDPSSSAFSVVVASKFAGSGSSKWALAKGNNIAGGSNDGYGFWTTSSANHLQFYVNGASTGGGPDDASSTWFDGNMHVAVGTSSGTAQTLYRDGTSVATSSVTHGSVSNAIALTYGAENGGASGFMASTFYAAAVYMRALTAAEAQAASYYLLGYPGYRMPAGAVLFHDLRDLRSWDGIRQTCLDLSGNNLTGTFVSTPPTRGKPWRLELLDRFG